jgi:hypothetical protein
MHACSRCKHWPRQRFTSHDLALSIAYPASSTQHGRERWLLASPTVTVMTTMTLTPISLTWASGIPFPATFDLHQDLVRPACYGRIVACAPIPPSV